MPRRAKRYVVCATYATNAALALVLAGALTGCTGSSGSDGDDDGKPGGSSASPTAAEPGKYRTLPKPCDVVPVSTLRQMLPGAAAAEKDGSASPDADRGPFEGEPSATYDTDRRVGCRWKDATTLSTRHLNVDFERVVSYDPAVSDDEQAEQLFAKKARKAGIPLSPDDADKESDDATESPEANTEDGKTHEKGEKGDGGEEGDGATKGARGDKEGKSGGVPPEGKSTPTDEADESATPRESGDPSSPAQNEDLAPRALEDIGDSAYIDDELHTADSGLHRDITLVFRTANVIATVEYDQWVTDKNRIPGSEDLQERARELAVQLAEQFED
ncbi:hypothetical protein ADL27_26735 [Streptomyces sp. NRRL F-6602]|nr:hypothetical protein ADL27_26735 [Streptomyces sp. NRRL F-6602]